ncbi:MAG: hypothetical protein NXH85_01035 [Pseudomonadaceae bacterium]|nr:hypothetical protein [Pseudomonadaceae bacterium]
MSEQPGSLTATAGTALPWQGIGVANAREGMPAPQSAASDIRHMDVPDRRRMD